MTLKKNISQKNITKKTFSQHFIVYQKTFWVVKKWPSEYQMVTKTYLPSYLCEGSDGSDGSDSIASSDENFLNINTFFFSKKKLFHQKKAFLTNKKF